MYGPVRSRRLGHSLGINVLPRNLKLCTFNCSYCQYGWTKHPGGDASATWPSPSAIAKAAGQVLQRLKELREPVDRVTLAGNGEPTLHPEFPAVVQALRDMRDAVAPGLPLAILSNSSTLDTPGVAAALDALDERYMKLDGADAAMLRRVNAAQVPFDRLVAGLKALRPIVVQSMFVKDRLGRIDNATDLAVANWIATLRSIMPAAVHVYTIDRAPAWPYLQPIPAERLEEIGRRAQGAGLSVRVFGAAPIRQAGPRRHAATGSPHA